jgi:hypothetical protein
MISTMFGRDCGAADKGALPTVNNSATSENRRRQELVFISRFRDLFGELQVYLGLSMHKYAHHAANICSVPRLFDESTRMDQGRFFFIAEKGE